jgi:hypothetical protein
MNLTKEYDILQDAFEPLILRGEIANGRRKPKGVYRLDDAYGDVELRSLEHKSPYTFIRRTPITEFDKLCLTKYDLVRNETSYQYSFEDSQGTPQIVGGTNDDVPVVELSYTTENIPIVRIELGISMTSDEIQTVDIVKYGEYGNNLLDRKVASVMKKMDERACQLGFYGMPNSNFEGLLTNSNVNLEPSAFDYYAQTDASAIATQFTQTFYDVWVASNSVEKPDTALIPLDLMSKMATTYTPTGDKRTALSLIKEELDPMGVEIVPRIEVGSTNLEINGALPAGTDRDMLVFYKRKTNPPDVHGNVYPNLERHMTPCYSYPWEYTNIRYKTRIRQDLTGVFFSFAGSALRVTIPKKA